MRFAAVHAGISEGLLSGCCGILNESVRRQIYIMRTSGARLLALINDVMDAAALRQHRLVLKQERLELRQVVGDVSDLTRSLVDNDVSLRNDVPEGMAVWADSGRIIQVSPTPAGRGGAGAQGEVGGHLGRKSLLLHASRCGCMTDMFGRLC